MIKVYHRKIKYNWNLYLQKFGLENKFRTRIKLRNAITVIGHAALKTAEK
jgi:hypothetical protein